MLADFVNQEKICQDSMVGSVIVPGEWNMHDTIHLCQGLGGQMSVVDSEKKQIFLSELFRNHSQCSQAGTVRSNCQRCTHSNTLFEVNEWYWNGWWDLPVEGRFENVNNGKVLTSLDYSRWGLGEPNGHRDENCGSVRRQGFWNDNSCYKTTCAFCDLAASPSYIMRGYFKHGKIHCFILKRFFIKGFVQTQSLTSTIVGAVRQFLKDCMTNTISGDFPSLC